MASHDDAMAIVLSGRGYLYQLLQHVFGHEPGRELLDAVTGEHTREVMELLSDEGEYGPDLELLSELREAIETDPEAVLDRLKSEYTYLLIGPNKLPAPPWESVYVTKERLILQESTLRVRRAYLKYQLLPAEYPHVADDHIAMELDFMARLAQMSQKSLEERDMEKLKTLLADQSAFLDEHLLKWVGAFAEEMQGAKTRHFYPQMARLTERFLRNDRNLLDELKSVIEEERCEVQ